MLKHGLLQVQSHTLTFTVELLLQLPDVTTKLHVVLDVGVNVGFTAVEVNPFVQVHR